MDDVASLHYDETPKAKYLRYIIWSLVGGFVTTVTIIALVRGFSDDGQQGHAFLGIACCLFTLITFYLQFKIITGDLSDVARIPVYVLLALCVFLGISILIVVYDDWHPSELDCYYEDSQTFVRQASPSCWQPPVLSGSSCFHSTRWCMMWAPGAMATAASDQCGLMSSTTNDTSHTRTYTCTYNQALPTPDPTPSPVNPSSPPPSSPPPSSLNKKTNAALKTYNADEEEQHINSNVHGHAKQNQDLLSYLNQYYSKYVQTDED